MSTIDTRREQRGEHGVTREGLVGDPVHPEAERLAAVDGAAAEAMACLCRQAVRLALHGVAPAPDSAASATLGRAAGLVPSRAST